MTAAAGVLKLDASSFLRHWESHVALGGIGKRVYVKEDSFSRPLEE